MEKVLERIARQLNAYDEASLMSLWDKYQARVKRFEPTRRWEEAVVMLCLIQSIRWKNQLFNSHWAEQQAADGVQDEPVKSMESENKAEDRSAGHLRPAGGTGFKQGGKVLSFRSRKDDESV